MAATHGQLTPLLRGAARTPGLRRLRQHPVIARFVKAHWQAHAAEQVWKYVLLELVTSRPARYTPRGNRVDVWLRHRTSDGNIAQETNVDYLYDPPPNVDQVLRGRKPLRVVDLGGHVGLFAARILSLYPDASVTSVELTSEAYGLLALAASRHPRWEALHAAAWNEPGRVAYRSDYAESKIDPDSPVTVDAIDVFPLLEHADLVKIDIEGSEWRILTDPRFRTIPAPVVVLEWHPDNCPEPDPRAAALACLHAAGYEVAEVPDASVAPGVGMAWGWRSESTVIHSTARC